MKTAAIACSVLTLIGGATGLFTTGLSFASWPPAAMVPFCAGVFGGMFVLAAKILGYAPRDSGSIDDVLPGSPVGPPPQVNDDDIST